MISKMFQNEFFVKGFIKSTFMCFFLFLFSERFSLNFRFIEQISNYSVAGRDPCDESHMWSLNNKTFSESKWNISFDAFHCYLIMTHLSTFLLYLYSSFSESNEMNGAEKWSLENWLGIIVIIYVLLWNLLPRFVYPGFNWTLITALKSM